ncbi:hypothetical protein CALCODRAFT_497962 [Calocera cornea HHB12733]|uniref:Uncharacterized protein n=1 Tax=Calocera cornea HHB12733 TaxID=1353952 RepID=A0A165F068_9BASI|nr:hypothetical protein CALCODRAFT_497962 [Calocera cornea HHB12733]
MGGSLNLERFGAGTESENLDRVITYLNRAVPVLVLAVRLAREHAIRRQISPSLPDDESDEDGDDEHSLLGYPTSYPPPRHLSIHPPPPTAYYPSSSIPVASSSTPNTDAFVPTNLDYPEQGPSNGHSGQVGNFDGHGSEALGGEMLGSFANMQLGFDYAPHDPTAMVQEESTTVNPSWLDLSLPQPQYPGQLHSRHGAPLAYSQLDLSYLAESHF